MTEYIYKVSGIPVGFVSGGFVYELSGNPVAQLNGSDVHRLSGEYIGELFIGSIISRRFEDTKSILAVENPGVVESRPTPRSREVRGHGHRDVFDLLLRP